MPNQSVCCCGPGPCPVLPMLALSNGLCNFAGTVVGFDPHSSFKSPFDQPIMKREFIGFACPPCCAAGCVGYYEGWGHTCKRFLPTSSATINAGQQEYQFYGGNSCSCSGSSPDTCYLCLYQPVAWVHPSFSIPSASAECGFITNWDVNSPCSADPASVKSGWTIPSTIRCNYPNTPTTYAPNPFIRSKFEHMVGGIVSGVSFLRAALAYRTTPGGAPPDLSPCVMMIVKCCVTGIFRDCGATPTATTTATYRSYWNGSDTLAQWLAKGLTLFKVSVNDFTGGSGTVTGLLESAYDEGGPPRPCFFTGLGNCVPIGSTNFGNIGTTHTMPITLETQSCVGADPYNMTPLQTMPDCSSWIPSIHITISL